MYNKEKLKQYYIDNKESIKAKARQYYYDNIEKRKKYNNAYWAIHGDKYKETRELKRKEKKLDKPKLETPKIYYYQPKQETISKNKDIIVSFA